MRRRKQLIGAALVALAVAAVGLIAASDGPPAASPPETAPLAPRARAPEAPTLRPRPAEAASDSAAAGRTVTVEVRDCGLRPAAGAEVALSRPDGIEVARGRADARGRFRVALLATGPLVATAALGTHEGSTAPEAADTLALSVCPGATLEGRVLDRHGRPVAGATVTLGDGLDVTLTEEDGEFTLTDLALVATQVRASAEGASASAALAPLTPREVRRLDLTLEAGRLLRGWVLDPTGEPVSNANLSARDFADTVVARSRADRQGRFWLREVPLTPVTLFADDGAGGAGSLFVDALARGDDLVITLEPAGRLTVDYRGPHRGSFDVVVVPLGHGVSHDPPTPVATLAASGDVAVLPAPRKYWVVYGTKDAVALCGEVLLTPGAFATVRCGSPEDARVIGRVVDARGRPIAGAIVAVMSPGTGLVEAEAGADGRFTVALAVTRTQSAGLAARTLDGAFLPTRRRNVPLGPGETTDVGELRLDAADAFPELGRAGPFGGIGAQVETVEDGIRLGRVVRGGPLDRAGVRPGEVITAIGEAASGFLPSLDAVRLLRGAPGSAVTLRVRGPDGATREVRVERAVIDVDAAGWVP